MRYTMACTAVLASLGPIGQAAAQGTDVHLGVNGFGTWAAGITNNNNVFLFGRQNGDAGYMNVGLHIDAAVNRQLRVVVQLNAEIDGRGQPTNVALDLGFAEWRVSDALQLRAGFVKNPFGIYTEIVDIGTVRPFLLLPQSVYGPAGFVADGYKGLGITGHADVGRSWGVSYDAYVGEFDISAQGAPVDFFVLPPGQALGGDEILSTKNVIGGRVVMQTPIDGLSIGGSGYTGSFVAIVPGDTTAPQRSVVAGQVEYLTDRWSVRSEAVYGWGRIEEGVQTAIDGEYIEVGYRLTPHWQLAGLFDRQQTQLKSIDASAAPSLLHHEDWAGGINYWFSPNFVLKLSDHIVNGNGFALPNVFVLRQVVAAGNLRAHTNLLQFGSQFSF
jgi:hypothetical protein